MSRLKSTKLAVDAALKEGLIRIVIAGICFLVVALFAVRSSRTKRVF